MEHCFRRDVPSAQRIDGYLQIQGQQQASWLIGSKRWHPPPTFLENARPTQQILEEGKMHPRYYADNLLLLSST